MTHGHAKRGKRSPTYITWQSMMARCYRRSHNRFKHYGARGIKVCERWRGKDGFKNFLADMGERPEGLSLDRIKVNEDYAPGNCRWATREEQEANKRSKQRGEEPWL